MNAARIVVVGSLNSDLVAFLDEFPGPGETVTGHDFKTFPGGKGANQAYAAARLGAATAMIGQVGQDAAGDIQIRNLQQAGVETSHVCRHESAPTGTAIIGVDRARQNRIVVIPGANGAFTPAHLEPCATLLGEADFVLLQLEIPMETVIAAARLAKAGRAQVVLDPAPAAPLPAELWGQVDYLTPNVSELATLAGIALQEASDDAITDAARTLCWRGVPRVIAKLGERGAMLVSSDEVQHWPAFPVTPVDTTAAGDCFNAAFAAALLDAAPAGNARAFTSADHARAGRFACAAAAIAVTRPGAQPGMPTRDEVEALLARP